MRHGVRSNRFNGPSRRARVVLQRRAYRSARIHDVLCAVHDAHTTDRSAQEAPYPWSQRPLLLQPPIVFPQPGVRPPAYPSPSPFPRFGAASPVIATPTGELFILGGLVGGQIRNDLYMISVTAPPLPPSSQTSALLSISATLLQTEGEIPTPRVGQRCAMVGSVLIVWGGDSRSATRSRAMVSAGERLDDGLYLLNLGA